MISLARLAGSTGFRRFFDFVSPAFFDVVPARQLWREASDLVSSRRDEAGFLRLVEHKAGRLAGPDAGLVVDLDAPDAGRLEQLDPDGRAAAGQAVLRLYFGQVFAPEPILLDLGKSRFTHGEGRVVWRPGKGHVTWSPAFHEAIRGMYRGFYREDDAALESALGALELGSAAPIFRRHFGEGDQSAVTFTAEHFVGSFHEVFVHCKEEKIRLHSNFLSLGLYLATLYETLESLGVPLDVRRAFMAVDE